MDKETDMTAHKDRTETSLEEVPRITIRPEGITDQPHSIALHLEGDLDIYNSVPFRREIERLIGRGFVNLLFDVGRLGYISSGGVGALVELLRAVRSRGGDIILTQPQPRVREVLHLLGFSGFFTFVDSMAEGIRHLAACTHAAIFPKIENCPICRQRLRFSREGRFRCPECKTLLLVTRAAEITLA
jgi:anti-sigma B factor antagonist